MLRVIGRGAFGKVFLAKKISDNTYYAMKKMSKEQVKNAGVVENIKRERDILTELDHPYIIKLHYAFQTNSTLYLAMDFVNGGELFSHM